MNIIFFRIINGAAHDSGMLDKIMVAISGYGPLLFMAVLAGFYLYDVYSKEKMLRYAAVDTIVMTAVNLFLGFVIGSFYFEPRPFVTNKVNLLTPHAADTSFPSDHSLGTMSIALGINNYNKIYGKILIIFSLIVGVSRVYVGVHYPMDVIGSYLIAFAMNFIYGHLLRDKVRDIYFKIESFMLKRINVIKHVM